jgi:rubrerythrin
MFAPSAMASTSLKSALVEAYQDELNAYMRYESIIQQFGDIRPFSNLVGAEERHMNLLEQIFKLHGWSPLKIYHPVAQFYSSVLSACDASLEAEESNVAMYDRLVKDISDEEAIAVFLHLRQASAERHIPALQRCAGLRLPE